MEASWYARYKSVVEHLPYHEKSLLLLGGEKIKYFKCGNCSGYFPPPSNITGYDFFYDDILIHKNYHKPNSICSADKGTVSLKIYEKLKEKRFPSTVEDDDDEDDDENDDSNVYWCSICSKKFIDEDTYVQHIMASVKSQYVPLPTIDEDRPGEIIYIMTYHPNLPTLQDTDLQYLHNIYNHKIYSEKIKIRRSDEKLMQDVYYERKGAKEKRVKTYDNVNTESIIINDEKWYESPSAKYLRKSKKELERQDSLFRQYYLMHINHHLTQIWVPNNKIKRRIGGDYGGTPVRQQRLN
ncbi:Hypothetical predicted protein [Mytilus galloprovincialis]|uniref:Uncharacterized protein n=1 Tax=Mytilus galloprovincialis TaxID=29158 RepID=A0A8B6BIN2_MYTGA|nr:Hypothetical predicted protein [Mytilus galloprovincialis]